MKKKYKISFKNSQVVLEATETNKADKKGKDISTYEAYAYNKNGDKMGQIEFHVEFNSQLFLDFLLTQSDFAHQGAATACVKYMEYIACKKGMSHIDGLFVPANRDAGPFYESHGYIVNYRGSMLRVTKNLDLKKDSQPLFDEITKEKIEANKSLFTDKKDSLSQVKSQFISKNDLANGFSNKKIMQKDDEMLIK